MHTETPDTSDIPHALHTIRLNQLAARREVEDCQRWLAQREAELTLVVDGKNETERKARILLALVTDERAVRLREAFRQAQEYVSRLEADEQYLRDVRRAREWAIRERVGAMDEGD
jgi:hypothetical protein